MTDLNDLNDWDPEPSETIFPQTYEESPELPDDSASVDLDFFDRLQRLASSLSSRRNAGH